MYDFLICGAGLSGTTIAHELHKAGYKDCFIDKNEYLSGNCRIEKREEFTTHRFGIHVFNTKNTFIWDYVQQFTPMLPYRLNVLAQVQGTMYSNPINMYTFEKFLGIRNPITARNYIHNLPQYPETNAEAAALNRIGKRLYYAFFRDQLTKHWGKEPKELDASIVTRIPIRYTYDTRYYDTMYEGLLDYNTLVENMLEGIEVRLGVDFFKTEIESRNIIYTGMIDQFYNYQYGALEYRTLDFDWRIYNQPQYFGAAMVRYDNTSPHYRSIEWNNVYPVDTGRSLVSYETARQYTDGDVPMYPVLTEHNKILYKKYKGINTNVIFAGRLGTFKYLNMDQALLSAYKTAKSIIGG
jgi:UDP-galactopyranose mutase